jgi:hypothetical protein
MSSQDAMKDVAEPGYRYPFAGGALSGTEYGEGASPAYAPTGARAIAAPAAAPNHRIFNLSRVGASLLIISPSPTTLYSTPTLYSTIYDIRLKWLLAVLSTKKRSQ